jgi:hypothetical protein
MRISSIFDIGSGDGDPPPTDAECVTLSGDSNTLATCRALEEPVAWRSGHRAVPFPPTSGQGRNFYHSRSS